MVGTIYMGRLATIAKRPSEDAFHALVRSCREGGITLVLGAGISIPRGIPKWDELAAVVWKRVFGKRSAPWKGSFQKSLRAVPQFLPIVFELACRERGEAEFIQILRESLYAKAVKPADDPGFVRSKETLALVARLIVREHKRKQGRRIDAIITFNADDLLEQAVGWFAEKARGRPDVVRPIARSTHVPLTGSQSRSVPVYHIHGFVPSSMGRASTSSADSGVPGSLRRFRSHTAGTRIGVIA